MEILIKKLNNIFDLQKEVLLELNNLDLVETDNNSNKVNIDYLENIEKYYFMLDIINKNTYQILDLTKKTKDHLQNYSTKIRSSIKKETNNTNNNKFINILDLHFNSINNEMQLNTEKHREIYESIQQYHKLQSNNDISYTLEKTVKLFNQTIKIPFVNSLKEIPPIFHWWNGDASHKSGIYICLSPNFYLEVPFPDLICKNSDAFKHKSIPCKYKTTQLCYEKQIDFSKIYKTEIRQCNFVHIGEQFIKIGSDFRCPNLPSFGAYDTLTEDLNSVTLPDIKTILMNSSSDLLLIYLWYSQHQNLGEIIFTDLDIFR